jgi:hypothetical protein
MNSNEPSSPTSGTETAPPETTDAPACSVQRLVRRVLLWLRGAPAKSSKSVANLGSSAKPVSPLRSPEARQKYQPPVTQLVEEEEKAFRRFAMIQMERPPQSADLVGAQLLRCVRNKSGSYYVILGKEPNEQSSPAGTCAGDAPSKTDYPACEGQVQRGVRDLGQCCTGSSNDHSHLRASKIETASQEDRLLSESLLKDALLCQEVFRGLSGRGSHHRVLISLLFRWKSLGCPLPVFSMTSGQWMAEMDAWMWSLECIEGPNEQSSPAGTCGGDAPSKTDYPACEGQVQRGVRVGSECEHANADDLGKNQSQELICARQMTFREWLLPIAQSQKLWECVVQREPDPASLKNALDLWKAAHCPLVEGWQDNPRYPLDLERDKWKYLQVFLDSLDGGKSPNDPSSATAGSLERSVGSETKE